MTIPLSLAAASQNGHPNNQAGRGGLQPEGGLEMRERSLSHEEQKRRIDGWHKEDECFAVVNTVRLMCLLNDDEAVAVALRCYRAHETHCGRCTENLIEVAESTRDWFKKKTYSALATLWQFEVMKYLGGDYKILETPVVHRISFQFPPDYSEGMWCGLELCLDKRPGKGGWIALDARDESVFANPRRLKQELDRLAVEHAKKFAGQAAQWWTVATDTPVELRVRWQGRVESLGPST